MMQYEELIVKDFPGKVVLDFWTPIYVDFAYSVPSQSQVFGGMLQAIKFLFYKD